ncbi:hypothetical protein AVB19_05220 [Salmonella enterica subsp. enterica serovar Typhimurium]|nr:hypothetical protein [Salmonella enterica subsp. enterica serovar Typhimurium]
MSEVKRYDISAFGGMSMDECSDGAYVNYEDYAALEAKCTALAAESARLKHAMSVTLDHLSVTDTGKAGVAAMIINYALHHSETTSTDAFLSEVLAQGVEMFAQWCRGERDFTLIDDDVADAAAYEECVKRAEYFAAQLRKGGEQK